MRIMKHELATEVLIQLFVILIPRKLRVLSKIKYRMK